MSGIAPELAAKYQRLGAQTVRSAEVEAALASRGMMVRVLWEKQQQLKKDRK